MTYRKEIDGLRAIAVLPVILFHAGIGGFGGGFVGVDVFFVISGYLITSIILADLQEGRFSLAAFYERRARRILPALLFVVACCIPVAWLLLLPGDMEDFARSAVSVAVFGSNIFFWSESGYFDTAAELKPLLHTWSLAVEEQFYILFPLVLMVLWRHGRRLVLTVLAVAFAASLTLALWGAQTMPSASFYLLPARAWELLIGSFAAFWRGGRPVAAPRALAELMAAAGLCMIALAVAAFDKTTPFPGLAALLPTMGAVLVILFARRGTLVHTVLCWRPLVGIGLMSYSLYLWHHPIFAFHKHAALERTMPDVLALLALTFVLAGLSYAFVERPFRSASVAGRRQVAAMSAAGLLVLAATGGVAAQFKLHNPAVARPLEVADFQPDRDVLRMASWTALRQVAGTDALFVDDNAVEKELWFDPVDGRQRVLLVGNSHSKDLFNVLHHSAVVSDRFQIARYGVEIRDIGAGFFELPNYRLADVVIFASRYSEADLEAMPGLARRIAASGRLVVLTPNIFEFPDNHRFTLADRIVIPCLREADCDRRMLPSRVNRAHFEVFATGSGANPHGMSRALFERIAAGDDRIVLLDRMDYVCDVDAESCHAIGPRLGKFFYDYGHHTNEGAEFFGAEVDSEGWLDPLLTRMEAR